jgi:hypothetical protein
MARFRLKDKHYLHVLPGTEWEQKELDQVTGKQARKVYLVPLGRVTCASACSFEGGASPQLTFISAQFIAP